MEYIKVFIKAPSHNFAHIMVWRLKLQVFIRDINKVLKYLPKLFKCAQRKCQLKYHVHRTVNVKVLGLFFLLTMMMISLGGQLILHFNSSRLIRSSLESNTRGREWAREREREREAGDKSLCCPLEKVSCDVFVSWLSAFGTRTI